MTQCIQLYRYWSVLKNYVASKRHPEAGMSERHLVAEVINLAAMYVPIESMSDYSTRNYEGSENIDKGKGRAIGKIETIFLDRTSWIQAHQYVLANSDEVAPYRE